MGGDLQGKTVFVTGGSGGLGKSLAKLFASRGANVTIFARRKGPLNEAREEILASRISEDQEIKAIELDLSEYPKVRDAFVAQPRIPDALYCAAGGNHAENGFLVDIDANKLDRCMKNNYYATVYPTKVLVDIWTEDDKQNQNHIGKPRHRQVVFVSSGAAFLGLPGSIAYTRFCVFAAAKTAVRALADTLRMEFLRHSSATSAYTAHCAFPGDFVSPGFYLEQNTKTNLTKRMQGTDKPLQTLEANCPSSDKVASSIVAAVDRGEFIICDGSWAISLLFTNMIGPSVKRGFGVLDSLLSILAGWLLYPILRRQWDAMTKEDGRVWRNTWSKVADGRQS
ncbi:putative short chain dehydrogenase/ reductase [Xylaria cf. heliscus]|nr:putative short chain dehydrogenase/ reductase [Xylaria cf. heliscus]